MPDLTAKLPPEEQQLLAVIGRLNQRGGRMLSVVDLLRAGSLDLEMAAYVLRRIRHGASFLTVASPGGAGKTTVMGALLGMAPPGAVLREISDVDDLRQWTPDREEPTWHVCHELGRGRQRGYLWGEAVPAFFGLMGAGSYVVSNLHADTLEETAAALSGSPNDLPPDLFAGVDLILPLRRDQVGDDIRYRIAAIHAANGDGHPAVFEWDAGSDTFRPATGVLDACDLSGEREFLAEVLAAGDSELPTFRARLREFLGSD